jgi:hypothetical protein
VSSTHKGPINLDNLYEVYTKPSYEDISYENANGGTQNLEIVESKAELIDLPIAEAINRTNASNGSVYQESANEGIAHTADSYQSEVKRNTVQ